MKITLKTFVPFCAIAAAAFISSPVWGQDTKFYIKGDLGGNLTQDIDLNEFFGPVAPGSKIVLDPGIRAGVAGGYQFLDWLAAEAEIGYMGNNIKSITGASRVHDATFSNVPFLFNAKLQYPTRFNLVPYAGAGVGFSESIFDVDQITIGNVSLSGNDASTVFAYQAFAGLRYQLNERMGISVEYRYFVADSASWQENVTFGSNSDTMRFGRSETHALSLSFQYRF
jgi:opacity protein-like surface antigen